VGSVFPDEWFEDLVGDRVLVFVREDGSEGFDFFEATVLEVDPAGPTWTLGRAEGGPTRVVLDPHAVEPGRPGRVFIADSDDYVDEPDWIADYERDPATGRLVPAEKRVHPLLGQTVIVGLTRLGPTGEVESLTQWYGTIVEVTDVGIGVNVAGDLRLLPPVPFAFRGAAPGEYRLRSTGQLVIDPDLLCYWTVQRAPGRPHTDSSWARDWRHDDEQ